MELITEPPQQKKYTITYDGSGKPSSQEYILPNTSTINYTFTISRTTPIKSECTFGEW